MVSSHADSSGFGEKVVPMKMVNSDVYGLVDLLDLPKMFRTEQKQQGNNDIYLTNTWISGDHSG